MPIAPVNGIEICYDSFQPTHAEGTVEAIPGARLVLIDGMGHDIPRGAWPEIVDAIATNAERGSA